MNAARIEVRAAVPTEETCSSTRRHRACVSAAIAVASAAARYPIADCSIPSACTALAGGGTVTTWLTWLTSSGTARGGWVPSLALLIDY